MKKIIYVILVLITTLSLSVGAKTETTKVASNLLCDIFGISCPAVITADSDGGGKEPPVRTE